MTGRGGVRVTMKYGFKQGFAAGCVRFRRVGVGAAFEQQLHDFPMAPAGWV